jgi:hypothetical protein
VLLAKGVLGRCPPWVAPSRPRRGAAFLPVEVVVVAPGRAARAIPIAVSGSLLPVLFFLFTIQLLSEVLVTVTVVPLAFLEGALPVVRDSVHRGKGGAGVVGVVG